MKAELLPLEYIRKNICGKSSYSNRIYHSYDSNYLNIGYTINDFGTIIDIKLRDELSNRKIYVLNEGGDYSKAYYDEWFSWIGEEPQIFKLPDEL